jgi:excisionase family DNA binding protein
MSPLDAIVEQIADAVAARVAAILAERTTAAANTATPWLNVEEAAARIKAPVSRIYDLVAREHGGLEPTRDGRRLLFHTDDVDAYMRGGT